MKNVIYMQINRDEDFSFFFLVNVLLVFISYFRGEISLTCVWIRYLDRMSLFGRPIKPDDKDFVLEHS